MRWRGGQSLMPKPLPRRRVARPRVLTVNGPSLAEYEAPDLETSTGPRLPTFSTNPKESTFATVRYRTKATRGPGSKAAGLAMAFKLIETAQHRWRAVNAPHLVALVQAGAKFDKGKLVEREPATRDVEAPKTTVEAA